PPARRVKVVNKSILVRKASLVTPAGTCSGQRTMAGSRNPPSQVLTFPSKNGPADPPSSLRPIQGPLSEVKKTNVLSSIFKSFSARKTSPHDQSSSSTASPYSPRRLLPRNFSL